MAKFRSVVTSQGGCPRPTSRRGSVPADCLISLSLSRSLPRSLHLVLVTLFVSPSFVSLATYVRTTAGPKACLLQSTFTSGTIMQRYLFDSYIWLVAAVFITLISHGTLVRSNEKSLEEPDKTVVNVDVYYESLCSDSMRLIANQITPAYDELKQHLNITFIPYGKASHTRESETGPWEFSCQHGSAECRGNKAQSCAIHAIGSSEAAGDQQGLTVSLVHCVMTARSPSTAVPKCAKDAGLSEDTRKIISDCISGPLGNDLLAANGDKTNAFQSSLRFVPTVVINGVYSQENQDLALKNFSGLICQQLPDNKKPNLCKNIN